MSKEYKVVFKALRAILSPYQNALVLVSDTETEYYLNTAFIMKNKQPMYFGSVKINKRYVSFHLMPVYVFPELLSEISPALKKRMQGKSCFNFKQADNALFAELADLTKRGFEAYQNHDYVTPNDHE